MQFVASTPIALALCAALLLAGPVRGLPFLFLTMPLGAAAAVNLRGLGTITPTDLAVATLWLGFLADRGRLSSLLGTLRIGQPGLPLILLMITVTLGAVFLPRLFAGATEVFVIMRRDGDAVIALAPLQPVGGNVGQLFRMTISVSCFVVLATLFRRAGDAHVVLRAMAWATILHLLLAVLDLVSARFGLGLMTVIRTGFSNVLDNQFMSGIRRLIGGFPEASSFAFYTMGLFGFWLRYWFGARGSSLAALMLVISMALLLRSTSSAAWMGLTLYLLIFFAWQVRTIGKRQRSAVLYIAMSAALPAIVGAGMLAYTLVPTVSELFDRVLFTKLSSASGVERMEWNLQALRNFTETAGVGAGIGSVRGSGWLFVTLGSVGIMGTALYLWFILSVLTLRPPRPLRESHAALVAASLQSGCAAILLQACLTKSYPNLETPFFAMAGLAAGLLRGLALKRTGSENSRHIAPNTINST